MVLRIHLSSIRKEEVSMDATTRKYINNLAQQVIATYNIEIPITDINKVVKSIGGSICKKTGFDDLCDGTIKKSGEDSFEIAVSCYQSSNREIFTVAHELGHLFLHMGFRTNLALWQQQDNAVYTRFGSSLQESQANEFAGALLMPEEEYLSVLRRFAKGNKVDMNEVAQYFRVSTAAATTRGKILGYLA